MLFKVVRRYSDFELLACVLQKMYRGVVVPPLPPKAWGFSKVSFYKYFHCIDCISVMLIDLKKILLELFKFYY